MRSNDPRGRSDRPRTTCVVSSFWGDRPSFWAWPLPFGALPLSAFALLFASFLRAAPLWFGPLECRKARLSLRDAACARSEILARSLLLDQLVHQALRMLLPGKATGEKVGGTFDDAAHLEGYVAVSTSQTKKNAKKRCPTWKYFGSLRDSLR